jgi:type I restriction enzyme S subunit
VQAGPNVEEGIPYIRPTDMTDEDGVTNPAQLLKTSSEIAASYSRSTIRKGDLVCSIGPSFGKVMVVPPILDGANLTQGTARISVRTDISRKFVFWALRSKNSIVQWEASVGGATFRALNLGPLSETKLCVPPLSEQIVIAAFIDHETAKIDALIAEQENLISLLSEKRQATISHVVTRGLNPASTMKNSGVSWLGEVPVDWSVKRLKFLVRESVAGPYGSSLTKSMYVPAGYRVYGQQQVIADNFSVGDYYISEEKFAEMQRYQVAPDDVLISVMGTIGRAAVVPQDVAPGIINPRLVLYRVLKQLVHPKYLQVFLNNRTSQDYFSLAAQGTTMEGLNMTSIGELEVALPPVSEQVRILDFLRSEDEEIAALVGAAARTVTLLKERRIAVITAAVTGQIDVRRTVKLADRVEVLAA